MRDMNKQKEQGRQIMRVHERADMMGHEMMRLKNDFDKTVHEKGINEAIYNLICDSFYFGVAVGYRTRKRETTK